MNTLTQTPFSQEKGFSVDGITTGSDGYMDGYMDGRARDSDTHADLRERQDKNITILTSQEHHKTCDTHADLRERRRLRDLKEEEGTGPGGDAEGNGGRGKGGREGAGGGRLESIDGARFMASLHGIYV